MKLPTLVYFPVRGRAELIRFVLALAGVEYAEHPIVKDGPIQNGRPTDFAALKATGELPFDAAPVWEEPDGFRLAQSMAIVRYLGATHGLVGKDARDFARCDQMIGAHEDVRIELRKLFTQPAAERPGIAAHLEKEFLPRWMGFLDRQLAAHRDGTGFLVGDTATIGDLTLFYLLELLRDNRFDAVIEAHPRLVAFEKRVAALPRVAAYLASPKRFPAAPLPRS
jgi:glutathione S-transferase